MSAMIKFASLVLVGSLALACGVDSFPLTEGGGQNTADGGTLDGGPRSDAVPPDGGPLGDANTCNPIGVDDQCDNIDNDCDGTVDNDFDLQNDNANCGMCGNRCVAFGALQECQAGQCVTTGCQLGFKDLDGDGVDCEYACPVFPEQPEDCNGIDDDCDDLVDTADPDLIPAPTDQCRTTAGTPCAGTGMVCDTRNNLTRWYCNYSAQVEFDPSVPNGIFQQETLCDGFDGDCDGLADDPFAVGADCNNGLQGICFDSGTRICDPGDPSTTICNLDGNAQNPIAEQDISECNALDEDCDGSIDEGDHSVWVDIGGNVEIMAFEASRPDASALSAGGVESIGPCSKPGVLPWANLRYQDAEAACTAIGARLCTEAEWEGACAPNSVTVDNVIVEAEDNIGVVDGDSGRTWEEEADGNASGGAIMRATPFEGQGNFVFSASGAESSTQRMDFSVTLPNAGEYFVWVRAARGGTFGCQDFIWFGETQPEFLFKQFQSSSLLWYTLDFQSFRVTVNAATPNETLDFSIWMGCNNVEVDKIAFTQDPGYIPSVAADPPAQVSEACRYAYDDQSFNCLVYNQGVCNDVGYADPDEVYAAGTEAACFADNTGGSVFDLTGNLKEWAETRGTDENPIRGGGFNSGEVGSQCQFSTTADDDFQFNNIGFRCCRDI